MKYINRHGYLLGILLAALMPVTSAANTFELYGVTSTSAAGNENTLIGINPSNGAHTVLGGLGVAGSNHQLDWNPLTNQLVGTDIFSDPGVLKQVDLSTGIASTLATISDSSGPLALGPVAFTKDGTLYSVAGNSSLNARVLGQIDLGLETFTPLLEIPVGIRVASIDIDANGTLFAVYQQFSPLLSSQTLVSINLQSLSTISETPLSLINVGDLDFAADGFLYHSNSSFALFQLDPNSGAQTNLGFGSFGALGGLASAPVPIPGVVYVFAIALISLLRINNARSFSR